MRATRYLAKLYEMPAEQGEITALDSYASHMYVGTSKGTVLHFHVEGLPEYTDRGEKHEGETAGARGSTLLTAAHPQEESVFTSLLSRAVVSDQRGAVQRLQHSRTQALLFVQCDHRLTVWSTGVTAATTTAAAAGAGTDLTFLCEVGSDIGTFFVFSPPRYPRQETQRQGWQPGGSDPLHPPSSTASLPGGGGGAHKRSVSGNSGMSSSGGASAYHGDYFYPFSGDSSAVTVPGRGEGDSVPFSAALAMSGQRICVSQHKGRSLAVYEFNAVVARGDGQSSLPPRAARTQEFQLPEPALCLVMVNTDTVCVGLRQEYTLLSLVSGASRSILRLGTGRSAPPPLLALGDNGEVHMRYHKSVFSAALQGVGGRASRQSTAVQTPPPSATPLSPETHSAVEVAGPPVALRSGNLATPPPPLPNSTGSSHLSALRVLGRTAHVDEDVELMVSRHPFLLVFTKGYCDVFTAYEDDAIERLPLAGCLFASQLAKGDTVFTACRSTVWMLRLHPLRTQLADLVASTKIDEAFQLLASQRTRTGRRFDELELELHLMAGFTHLHHCHPREAMRHLDARVDPRDLLLHLPECLPLSPSAYSSALTRLLERGKQQGEGVTVSVVHSDSSSSSTCARVGETATTVNGALACAVDSPSYWQGWAGPCPYNTCTKREELLRAWLETFESYPFVPTSSAGGPSFLMLRQVPHMGPVSVTYFMERCWESFKDALVEHLDSRLAAAERSTDDGGCGRGGERESASVAAAPARGHSARAQDLRAGGIRAMSFALLVLALERQDRRAAYRLVRDGVGLHLADCYDLLCAVHEYRLLAILLFRSGYIAETQRLIRKRLSLTHVLAAATERDGVSTPGALRRLPVAVRRKVEETLLCSAGGPQGGGDTQTVAFTARQGNGEDVPLSAYPVDTACPTEVEFLLAPREGDEDCRPTPAAVRCAAPGDLSEVFYLVESMDLLGLRSALAESPSLALVRDSDGCTALHHAFAVLALLNSNQGGPACCRNAFFTEPRTPDVDAGLLQFVLAASSLLVDYGCSLSATTYGSQESCLDVAARVCDGVMLDLVVASLLAAVEVNSVGRSALVDSVM